MAPPPEPERRLLKLRPNRRNWAILVIAGAPVVALQLANTYYDFIGRWFHLAGLGFMLGGAAFWVGLLGVSGAFSYRYRLDDQELEVRSCGRVVRTHPGRGYDRIEIVNGKLYQTKDNGSTRRIRIWPWLINSDDWAVFKAVAPKPRPMYDLPPMPPAQSGPFAEPEPVTPPKPPAPELLTVRYNRRRVTWLLVGCILVAMPSWLLWISTDDSFTNFDWWLSYVVLVAGASGVVRSIMALRSKICFSYDPRRRAVTTRSRWGSSTLWYPSNPSERLEYSVHTATIYKVAANGRRRRFVRMSSWLNEEDWTAVVDDLLASADAPERPPAAGPGDPMLRVRVNLWRAVSVAVAGIGSASALVVLDPAESGYFYQLLFGAVAGFLLLSGIDAARPLRYRRFLTFDSGKGRIILRTGTKRHAVYPSTGFARVEFSIYDGQVYEVQTNGERRRLSIPRWYMNRTDWQKFADAMIAHRQEQSVAGEPS